VWSTKRKTGLCPPLLRVLGAGVLWPATPARLPKTVIVYGVLLLLGCGNSEALYTPHLKRELASCDWDTADSARQKLVACGSAAIEPALEVFLTTTCEPALWSSAGVLAELAEEGAASYLSRRDGMDPRRSNMLLIAAAYSRGRISKSHREELLVILRERTDAGWYWALRRIGRLDLPVRSKVEVLALAVQDGSLEARVAALSAAGDMGAEAAPLVPALLRLLEDPSWIRTSSTIRSQGGMPITITPDSSQDDGSLAVLFALQRIGSCGPKCCDDLRHLSKDPRFSTTVRQRMREALEGLGCR
jgi:hypothetical protein